MSRIGKQPVAVPKGVEVAIDGQHVKVKGPKGELTLDVHPQMSVAQEDGELRVTRPSDQPKERALHGLTRALLANMVEGVTEGFSRTLEIQGVGYRAEKKGNSLNLALGFSHPVVYDPPEGVNIEVPNQTTIVVQGADKQAVGQAAAVIRGFRPPEPYKGKGIRYQGEQVRRKAGKTAGA
ncbi:MAG TPA: 50S ribosomal protein L6 [Longimicrobiales bacterium]|nr:50S ribosomal protein L6 [Longimicrobiales bacterium]